MTPRFSFRQLLLPALLFSAFPAFAQWTPDTTVNTPVCTATDKQVDPRMCDDGHGGAFIAWKDFRNGSIPDIYAQHIDSMGYASWIVDGVALCTNPSDQSTPAIVSDMKGGVIVAWSDWRSGIERDIYAQRINLAGTPLWTTDGVIVTNKPQREHNEKIISDDNYGAIVVWEQQNNTTGQWEIWAQHLDSSGNALWVAGGIQLAQVAANLLNPKVQQDGKGGAFVTWQDLRGTNYDIYVQRIKSDGTLMFTTTGKLVCGAAGPQTNPKIDPDSIGGAIIAWSDKRNGFDYDIYAQRVDSAGNMLWATDGVVVSATTGNQSAVDFICNTNINGVVFAWKDSRAGNTDIYAQKLDLSGSPVWAINGIAVCNATNTQLNPNVSGDGTGGVIICWQDSAATGYDIKAQRISNVILWPANGLVVSYANGDQVDPKNVSDKAGGSIFVWKDGRTGINDIYCQRMNDGTTGIGKVSSILAAQVFPNPCSENVQVSFSLLKSENVSVRIYNVMGALLSEQTAHYTAGNKSVKVSTASLSPGTYLVDIRSNGAGYTRKLVKE